MPVRPVPEGYSTVTPYLIIAGAAEAIDFYKKVFNATELMRFSGPGGTIGHAEIQIGSRSSRTSSTAIDPAQSSIRSATSGRSRRTSRMSHRKKCSVAWKRRRRRMPRADITK